MHQVPEENLENGAENIVVDDMPPAPPELQPINWKAVFDKGVLAIISLACLGGGAYIGYTYMSQIWPIFAGATLSAIGAHDSFTIIRGLRRDGIRLRAQDQNHDAIGPNIMHEEIAGNNQEAEQDPEHQDGIEPVEARMLREQQRQR